MSANTDAHETVIKPIDRVHTAMLTTITEGGRHVNRPMAVREVEFDSDLWFSSHEDSDTVRQIQSSPQVNVALANVTKSERTSISGTATVVQDRAKAEELGSKPLERGSPTNQTPPGLSCSR